MGKEIFTQRNWFLLTELICARFECDDRNSVLGLLWSLLDPAAMLAAMYFIFKTRFGKGIAYYPLYLLIGIVLVNFFVAAISQASRSLVTSREMLLNACIPPEDIIIVDVFMSFYKFLIEIVICIILSICVAHASFFSVVMAIPILFSYIAMVIGVSFIIAIVNCLVSDTAHIWSLCSRFFYIVTPIFYNLYNISPFAQKAVYYLNPLTPFLISFQTILLGQGKANGFTYVYSLVFGSLIFIVGYSFFMRMRYVAVEKA